MTASPDASERARRRAIGACIVAALLAVAVLAPYGAALVRLSTGNAGWLGFVPDYDGVIQAVTLNSPAAHAGLTAGDRFDLGATPVAMRRFAVNQIDVLVPPGTRVVLAVRHAGLLRTVTLHVAKRLPPPAFTVFIEITQWFGDLAGIAIAFLILVRRHGPLAWMLYLYALSVPAATDQAAFGGLPFPAYVALTVATKRGIRLVRRIEVPCGRL